MDKKLFAVSFLLMLTIIPVLTVAAKPMTTVSITARVAQGSGQICASLNSGSTWTCDTYGFTLVVTTGTYVMWKGIPGSGYSFNHFHEDVYGDIYSNPFGMNHNRDDHVNVYFS